MAGGSYFARYYRTAVRYQTVGIVLLLAGIVIHAFFSGLQTLGLLLAAPGVLLVLFGGASSQPHNLVKAFAQQCIRNPERDMAQGLLDALTKWRTVRLVSRSIQLVDNAVAVYAGSDNADPALVEQLEEAVRTHIRRKRF